MKMNRFIEFKKKDEVEEIKSIGTGDVLATIYYDSDWKKYVVDFGDCIFDDECLDAVSERLKELKKVN